MELRLTSVHCRTTVGLEQLAALFDVLGASVTRTDGRVVADVGNATIVYARDDGASGVVGIELTGGIRMGDRLLAASGLDVTVTSGAGRRDAEGAPIRLDHLAIGVADLAAAEQRWASITGAPPEPMGVHPASGGAFTATRFVLGPQMIELVSPVPGVDSPIARRIARHGDGPVTLALPVDDLDRTIAHLREIDVDVLRTDHHVMLHARDAGGALVQLTPRIAH